MPTVCKCFCLLGLGRLLSLRKLKRAHAVGLLKQGQPLDTAAGVQEVIGTEQPDETPRAPSTLLPRARKWESSRLGTAVSALNWRQLACPVSTLLPRPDVEPFQVPIAKR